MIFFLALIPATALAIGGYLVLYLSGRSEGAVRSFGRYLSFWAFTLAALVILGTIFAAAHEGHRWHRFNGPNCFAMPLPPGSPANPPVPPAPESPPPK
jgi:hypothetical protein